MSPSEKQASACALAATVERLIPEDDMLTCADCGKRGHKFGFAWTVENWNIVSGPHCGCKSSGRRPSQIRRKDRKRSGDSRAIHREVVAYARRYKMSRRDVRASALIMGDMLYRAFKRQILGELVTKLGLPEHVLREDAICPPGYNYAIARMDREIYFKNEAGLHLFDCRDPRINGVPIDATNITLLSGV